MLLATACSSTTTGGPTATNPSGTPSKPAAASGSTAPVEPSAPTGSTSEPVSDTARVEAPPGGTLLVRGTYPKVESRCVRYHRARLTARYPGALTVRRADDGSLSLTVTLGFEDYLKGIAEVPPSWPKPQMSRK